MTFYTRGAKLYIDFNVGGKRVRKATGLENTPKNREYVENNLALFATTPPKKTTKQVPKIMLSCIINQILKEAKGLKADTQAAYVSRLGIVKNALCGNKHDLPISEITRDHIAQVYELFIKKDYSKARIKSLMQILKRIFNHALDVGAIQKNPLYKQKFNTAKDVRDPKPLTLQQVELMLKGCDDLLFKSYLATAFFTGARCGELYALTWENIDFEKNEIEIYLSRTQSGLITTPKTKSSRRIIDMLPIVKKALLKLKALQNPASEKSYIFANSAKDIALYRQKWNELLAKVGLEPRVLYNTRHTFASIMLNEGENAMWVGCKMMGHKDLNITFAAYARFLKGQGKQRASFLNNKEDLI